IEGRESWPEGCDYNYYKNGHVLRIFLAEPNSEEIESVRNGRAELALVVERDIIILLYQFKPGLPWSDTPYSWHTVAEPLRTIPELNWSPNNRDFLNVILVDA